MLHFRSVLSPTALMRSGRALHCQPSAQALGEPSRNIYARAGREGVFDSWLKARSSQLS